MGDAVKVAGGVVYRRNGDTIEILIIDDRYGHVSLPKGHVESGETLEQAALREIKEETGITGHIIGLIDKVSYGFAANVLSDQHKVDASISDKMVQKEAYYYLVEATAGRVVPQQSEVDGARFVLLNDALVLAETHGYPNNIPIFERAIQMIHGLEVI